MRDNRVKNINAGGGVRYRVLIKKWLGAGTGVELYRQGVARITRQVGGSAVQRCKGRVFCEVKRKYIGRVQRFLLES
jgi:hypothetical protein